MFGRMPSTAGGEPGEVWGAAAAKQDAEHGEGHEALTICVFEATYTRINMHIRYARIHVYV